MNKIEHADNPPQFQLPIDSDNIKRILDTYDQVDTQLSSTLMSSMEVLLSGLIHKETQLEKNQEAMGEPMELTALLELTSPVTGLIVGSYALLCTAQDLNIVGPPILQIELKKYRQMTIINTLFYGDDKRLDLIAKTTLSHDDSEIAFQAFCWGGEGYICMNVKKEDLDSHASSKVYSAIVANMMLDATKLPTDQGQPTLTHKL